MFLNRRRSATYVFTNTRLISRSTDFDIYQLQGSLFRLLVLDFAAANLLMESGLLLLRKYQWLIHRSSYLTLSKQRECYYHTPPSLV